MGHQCPLGLKGRVKEMFQRKCFSVTIAKILSTAFLQNNSDGCFCLLKHSNFSGNTWHVVLLEQFSVLFIVKPVTLQNDIAAKTSLFKS